MRKVTADGRHGSFCLLPRHVDCVAALAPGLFTYVSGPGEDATEEMLALDEGVLVKCGDEVRVSVRHAVRGGEEADLEDTIRTVFEQLDEGERKSRSALARLEAAFVTEFVEMQEAP